MVPEPQPETLSRPVTKATFSSILYRHDQVETAPAGEEQAVSLADLQLNQIIAAVTAGREQYDLTPFYHHPLRDVEAITYRHQVLAELKRAKIRAAIDSFAHSLQEMRRQLLQAGELRYSLQCQAVFAKAVERYCSAVEGLREDLKETGAASPGFLSFLGYLKTYTDSGPFNSLASEVRTIQKDLNGIRYCLRIKGSRVTVSRYEGELDHTGEIQETFRRFQQGELADYEDKDRKIVDMDHVEAMIAERVAKLFPDIFSSLDRFFQDHQGFGDEVVLRFDREIQFYLAYLDRIAPLVEAGLAFCIPAVSASKELRVEDAFDLALALSLMAKHQTMVCNDFRLEGEERVLVVSGPNQGGKTTFARTVGQLHYLASLGLPVPGTLAELFLPDKIFTHFERGENTQDLRGKLMDDLVRIHDIIQHATPESIVILNEIFTSTTLADAISLGGKILGALTELGIICVCVTFVDELASLNRATVSMVSTVDEKDPARRTFKIVRKPADGLAYAMVLARKYRLSHDQLKERILP